jgi:endogenous inhibitor of DNA gyrase (YacG/DUF329 family)
MTENQKIEITEMRNSGLGFTAIASRLHLTRIAVRAFCKAQGLNEKRSPTLEMQNPALDNCKTCGKQLKHTAGKKNKKYCSDRCRMDWWNTHPNKVKRKAFYLFTCAFCGDEFTAYGNAKRKYCCHKCYIYDQCSQEYSS